MFCSQIRCSWDTVGEPISPPCNPIFLSLCKSISTETLQLKNVISLASLYTNKYPCSKFHRSSNWQLHQSQSVFLQHHIYWILFAYWSRKSIWETQSAWFLYLVLVISSNQSIRIKLILCYMCLLYVYVVEIGGTNWECEIMGTIVKAIS